MAKPLFLPGLGDLLVVGLRGFGSAGGRASHLGRLPTMPSGRKCGAEKLEETRAVRREKAWPTNSAHTAVYTQLLQPPAFPPGPSANWSCGSGSRGPDSPCVSIALSSVRPEAIYVAFPLPCQGVLPRLSNGGLPFVPFRDQFPGTCRDYFAIDGWADYQTPTAIGFG